MSIEKKAFGKLSDGRNVEKYIMKNSNGMATEILTYGCRIAKLFAPDRDGKSENIVLGHNTPGEYEKTDDFLGAVIGRCANRIAGAEFKIDGKTYRLAKNDGCNSLHSAPGGYQNQIWRVTQSGGSDGASSVTFSYFSKDGECGFPGNVNADVTYTLTGDNALMIEYTAETDAETLFNPTNHSYFNITGDAGKSILPLEMQINADFITEMTDDLIPTGNLVSVADTPYDFRYPKSIGRDIYADDRLLKTCCGYDNNFVLNGPANGIKKAAELHDRVSGRKMLVFTDMPGMQVFTANNFRAGSLGTDGRELKIHHAVCLETQFFPDSVHWTKFPYQNLKPGTKFKTTTIYKFTTD